MAPNLLYHQFIDGPHQKMKSRVLTKWLINVLLIAMGLGIAGDVALSLYVQYQRAAQCAQFMTLYAQHPPTDVSDYVLKDHVFNDLCTQKNEWHPIIETLAFAIFVGVILGMRKVPASQGKGASTQQ